MYKMKVYKRDFETGQLEFWRYVKSYNLQYFDTFKSRSNFAIEIFEKKNNKWILIYTEVIKSCTG